MSVGDGFVIGLFEAVPTAAVSVAMTIRSHLGIEATRVAIAVECSPLERIDTWGFSAPLLRVAADLTRTVKTGGLWLSEQYVERARKDEAWGSWQVGDESVIAPAGKAGTDGKG